MQLDRIFGTQRKFENVKVYNIEQIRGMAQLLADNQSHLVNVAPSLATEYLSRMSFDDFHEIEVLSNSLSLETNIMIYDFSEFFHTDSAQNNLYFYDDDHLTLEGAKVFSAALKERNASMYDLMGSHS